MCSHVKEYYLNVDQVPLVTVSLSQPVFEPEHVRSPPVPRAPLCVRRFSCSLSAPSPAPQFVLPSLAWHPGKLKKEAERYQVGSEEGGGGRGERKAVKARERVFVFEYTCVVHTYKMI